MFEWKNLPSTDGYALDWDRVFLIPTGSSECDIFYGDEYCTMSGFSVQELVDKFKASGCNILGLTKTEVKTTIERIIKEN